MGNYEQVDKALCQYCYREYYVSHIHLHEPRCVLGPFGEEIKAFLRETATDGQMISTTQYNKRKPKDFPMHGRLVDLLGSWVTHVAPWAGLEYIPSSQVAWKYEGAHNPSNFVPEVEFIPERVDPGGIPILGWEYREVYDWTKRAYVPMTLAVVR